MFGLRKCAAVAENPDRYSRWQRKCVRPRTRTSSTSQSPRSVQDAGCGIHRASRGYPEGLRTYHVVASKMMAADVVKLKEAKTVNDAMVAVKVDGGNVTINNAKVTTADIEASNGVIHVIHTVLLPPAN